MTPNPEALVLWCVCMSICGPLGKNPYLFLLLLTEQKSQKVNEQGGRHEGGQGREEKKHKHYFVIVAQWFEHKNTQQHLRTTLREGAKYTTSRRKHRDHHTLRGAASCWCRYLKNKNDGHHAAPSCPPFWIAVESCRYLGQKIATSSHMCEASIVHSCPAALLVSQGWTTHQGPSVKDCIDHWLNVARMWGARVTWSCKWIIDPLMWSGQASKRQVKWKRRI